MQGEARGRQYPDRVYNTGNDGKDGKKNPWNGSETVKPQSERRGKRKSGSPVS